MITQDDLIKRLADLCEQFHIPGAAFAVAMGDETAVAWTGTANLDTGMPVEQHTLFAAGSVTKVFTASLLLTLNDEGLVDLDSPVSRYLPEFADAGDPRYADISVGMLLDHTSGLPGNTILHLERGPQVLQEFVAAMLEFDLNSPPGEYWSYSNGALNTAGRIAEVVTGQTFTEALDERVLRPLGVNATSDLGQMLLRSTAVGHQLALDGSVTRTPQFTLGTQPPAGSELAVDVEALVAFGRMHLAGGRAADGSRVLSADAVATMQTGRIDIPWGMGGSRMGLGWFVTDTPAGPLLTHTGASAGQHSCLYVLPERQLVLAALTNGTAGPALYGTLTAQLLEELCAIPPTAPPAPSEEPIEVDHEPLIGVWTADDGQVTVESIDGALVFSMQPNEVFLRSMHLMVPQFPPPPTELLPFAADGRFLTGYGMPVMYVTPTGAARPEYLYAGRIYRRTE